MHQTEVPAHAEVVVIGGGIVGCSVAYHLARAGSQVVLLEQHALAGGTTWHAAGMVTRLRTSHAMAILNDYSAKLYAGLESETGLSTGWKQVGSLLLARTRDRVTQHRRAAALAMLFGIECHEIAVEEAACLWPGMRTDDLAGAFWLPDDGRVDPLGTALALAQGARMRGATIVEGIAVHSILWHNGNIAGVGTSAGRIRSDCVVLCAGMWSRQLGLDAGVDVPLWPVEHHYAVSKPIGHSVDDLPCTRDHDGAIYFRGEGESIVLGAFQKQANPWLVDRIPQYFSFQLLDDDWDTFEPAMREGRHRLPVLGKVMFERFVNGPESFTPDNNFLLGPVAGHDRLFVAAGFNSAGIACAGGAGWALAAWIRDGAPPTDLWSVDPRRFAPEQNNRAFLRERVAESLGLHYQMAWPGREFESARGLRRSPLHDRLAAMHATFGTRLGWERPLWYGEKAAMAGGQYSFDRPPYFASWASEHQAARERAALFDQSTFAKFLVRGPDACAALNRMCGNDVDVQVGRAVYTGMFNARGTFESDVTVLRVARDAFYIVSSTAQEVRDADWISAQLRGMRAELTNVTSQFGVIAVMGPRSRSLLQPLTDADLSHSAFPFGAVRYLGIGKALCMAVRITYVGELGWELYIPIHQTCLAFDTIVKAGVRQGVQLAGTHALNSLRLEKAYRAWGTDVSTVETPLQAGLGFTVAWNKREGFIGRDALAAARAKGVRKRLVSFVLADPAPVLWGGEPIVRDGEPVGHLSSGSYGHTLGAAVGMGYVQSNDAITAPWITNASYAINVAGDLYAAQPYLRAPYDPDRTRIFA